MLAHYRNTITHKFNEIIQSSSSDHLLSEQNLEHKGAEDVWAPPGFWGPWVPIFSQFGVTGPNPGQHKTTVNVAFNTVSPAPSSFRVQIRGGDRLINKNGPGSTNITITGNVASTLEIRCRSNSIGQNIRVTTRP